MHRVKDLVREPGAKHPKMTTADIRQIKQHVKARSSNSGVAKPAVSGHEASTTG